MTVKLVYRETGQTVSQRAGTTHSDSFGRSAADISAKGCNCTNTKHRDQTAILKTSGIGARLKAIINRDEPGVVTCSTCRETIEELNAMTPEEVLADLDQYVNDMAHRAREQAPKLWQRIAVRIDLAVASAVDAATGIDMSKTKKRIKNWIIEACEVLDPDSIRSELKKTTGSPPRLTGR